MVNYGVFLELRAHLLYVVVVSSGIMWSGVYFFTMGGDKKIGLFELKSTIGLLRPIIMVTYYILYT